MLSRPWLLGTSFAGISERGCNPVLGVFKKGPSVCHSHSRLNARWSGTSVTYAELSLRLYETGQSSGRRSEVGDFPLAGLIVVPVNTDSL